MARSPWPAPWPSAAPMCCCSPLTRSSTAPRPGVAVKRRIARSPSMAGKRRQPKQGCWHSGRGVRFSASPRCWRPRKRWFATGRRRSAPNGRFGPIATCTWHRLLSTRYAGWSERLICERQPGIFHLSGDEDRPYTALAEGLARGLRADPGLIEPMSADAMVHPVEARPLYSSLDMSLEAERFDLPQPSFEETVGPLAATAPSATPRLSTLSGARLDGFGRRGQPPILRAALRPDA